MIIKCVYELNISVFRKTPDKHLQLVQTVPGDTYSKTVALPTS